MLLPINASPREPASFSSSPMLQPSWAVTPDNELQSSRSLDRIRDARGVLSSTYHEWNLPQHEAEWVGESRRQHLCIFQTPSEPLSHIEKSLAYVFQRKNQLGVAILFGVEWTPTFPSPTLWNALRQLPDQRNVLERSSSDDILALKRHYQSKNEHVCHPYHPHNAACRDDVWARKSFHRSALGLLDENKVSGQAWKALDSGSEKTKVSIDRKLKNRSCYLYSKSDQMLDWKEVRDHAAEAGSKGWNVEEIMFEGSGHFMHFRKDEEKFVDVMQRMWQENVRDEDVYKTSDLRWKIADRAY